MGSNKVSIFLSDGLKKTINTEQYRDYFNNPSGGLTASLNIMSNRYQLILQFLSDDVQNLFSISELDYLMMLIDKTATNFVGKLKVYFKKITNENIDITREYNFDAQQLTKKITNLSELNCIILIDLLEKRKNCNDV